MSRSGPEIRDSIPHKFRGNRKKERAKWNLSEAEIVTGRHTYLYCIQFEDWSYKRFSDFCLSGTINISLFQLSECHFVHRSFKLGFHQPTVVFPLEEYRHNSPKFHYFSCISLL